MPEAIAAALIYVVPALGATIFGTVTLASVITYSALLLGSVFLARALQPNQQPSAVQNQFPVRQALPPRLRSYGRCKVAGTLGFMQIDGGANLWVVQLLGSGQIDAIEEHWLGDDQMLVNHATAAVAGTYGGSSDGGGNFGVPEHNYGDAPGGGAASIYNGLVGDTSLSNGLGNADQLANPSLLPGFFIGDWTANDRWRGVPYQIVLFTKPTNSNVAAGLYPYGPPNYRAVARTALVYDPRVSSQIADGDPDRPENNNWTWSQNAALVILDFLRHPDGWAKASIDGARKMPPIALFNVASFVAFANLSDQPITVANSSDAMTVPRYLLAGTYDMGNTAPKDVLKGMMAACDCEIYRDGNGLVAIRGGQFGPSLEVTFDSSSIIGYELRPGASVFSAVNWLNAKFAWARADYNLVDMWPWMDQANIDLRGELLTDSLDLSWCPTNSQARRIAKINMAKRNPQWAGTVVLGAKGLLAFGERLIGFTIPELGITPDIAFQVLAFEPSPTLEKVKLTVASLDPAAYDWDADAEEGALPTVGAVMPDQSVPNMVPGPSPSTGGTAAQVNVLLTLTDEGTWTALVSWGNVSFITLFYEAEYSIDGLNWTSVPVPDAAGVSALSVTIAGIPSGLPPGQPSFQVRSVTPAGKASAWSPGVIAFASNSWSSDWSNDFGPSPP
jgi:hypothetical protein